MINASITYLVYLSLITVVGPVLNQPLSQSILVDVSEQKLFLIEDGDTLSSFDISSSEIGTGNKAGSNRTPLGKHRVHSKYGSGAEIGTIFKARQNTGRVAEIEYEAKHTGDDFVTTRILWLEGLEEGINKGAGIDSYLRYIYIHGTHEEGLIGKPASHGCIRMRNADVAALFNEVEVGTIVYIQE